MDKVSNEPKRPASLNASSHAPNLAVVPRASPSAIDGWDLIDESASAATDAMQVDGKDEETQEKAEPVDDGPTEDDIIVTDLATKEATNDPGQEVQTMSEADTILARSDIAKCAILGTLVSMLIEMMQLLQPKHPRQDPYEIASHIYKRCTDDENTNASLLYDAALAIALLVPFKPAVSSKSRSDEPTFLGHKVGEDHHQPGPQPAASDAIPTARIEYLILDPKDGWDRLYIGSVLNNVPKGVGCTISAQKDKASVSATRTVYGTW